MTLFERADSVKSQPSRPVKPQIRKKAFRETSYDDAFEAVAPYGESFHESVHSHIPSTPDESRKPEVKPARSEWQQAYVMREILNAPRSRIQWRSRMTR